MVEELVEYISDDDISKVKKEYMEMVKGSCTNIASEDYGLEDDTSWVADK